MSEKIEDKEPIILPFEDEKFDLGDWVYRHRIGLYVTLVGYLIVAIAFVVIKIHLVINPRIDAIAIDLQQLAELERERDELKKSVEILQQQALEEWEEIQNQISNESAPEEAMNEQESFSDVAELLEQGAIYQRQMESTREIYENAMAEIEAMKENRTPQTLDSIYLFKRDKKMVGNVTVSYYFGAPVRYAQVLSVPAYQCEGGGKVVINVMVNHNGRVTSARLPEGVVEGDECMQQTALAAAENSIFNVDITAPNRQWGEITYTFVAQSH